MTTRTVKEPTKTRPKLPPLPPAPPSPPPVAPPFPPAPTLPPAPEAQLPPPPLRAEPPGPARRWGWALAAGVAAVALVAGILVLTNGPDDQPGSAVSVARPTGLRVVEHTAASIELRWRAGKPAVDSYVILRDGAEVGQVPGGEGAFTDSGLLPDTTYSYQVLAELSGSRSAPSRAVVATTDQASLSTALLDGTWRVQMRITSAFNFNEITEGRRDSGRWTFDPRAKGVKVTGDPFKVGFFSTVLQRDGANLTGETREQLSACLTTGVTDTLTIRIRITKGTVRDGAWRTAAWTGTLEDSSPPSSPGAFSCGGSGYTAALVARPA